jgi:hypothetical protein
MDIIKECYEEYYKQLYSEHCIDNQRIQMFTIIRVPIPYKKKNPIHLNE